jgi:hypothetical protein
VEPAVGFEPTTDGLQNRCSTTELSWHQKAPEAACLPTPRRAQAQVDSRDFPGEPWNRAGENEGMKRGEK